MKAVTVAVDDGRFAVSLTIPLDDYTPAEAHQLATAMLAGMDEAFDKWKQGRRKTS